MPILKIPDSPDINYVRTGTKGGVPIFLVHALGLDLSVWEQQFTEFGADRDLIAIDLPGHGLSGTLDTPPDFATMARIVGKVIEHLDIGPVHLAGISVGGMIAQTVAVTRPDLLRSLTLIATSCTFPEPVRSVLKERAHLVREKGMEVIVPLHLDRWFPQDFRQRRPDVLDRFTKILFRQKPEFHAGMWDMVATLNVERQLNTLGFPVMVVAGDEDPSAPPAAGQIIVDRIDGARLVVIRACGHFPQIEHPGEFNSVMRNFVNQVESSR